MKSIQHHEAAKMNADGDFGYITLHDGSTGKEKKGKVIRWVWSYKYGTGVSAERYSHLG